VATIIGSHCVPSNKKIVFLSVSYTSKPGAGVVIDFLCDVETLGNRTPLLLLVMSKMALEFGVLVPMPVEPVCDFVFEADNKQMHDMSRSLFIVHFWLCRVIGWGVEIGKRLCIGRGELFYGCG